MNKRIVILVLLLLNVFLYSCSSKKSVANIKSKDVVIPVHSNHMHENLGKEKNKKEGEADLRQQHYERQTEYVQKEMKKNEKISMKNTPVCRKKKSCFSLFSKNKNNSACKRKADDAVVGDGVRDVRL